MGSVRSVAFDFAEVKDGGFPPESPSLHPHPFSKCLNFYLVRGPFQLGVLPIR